VTALKLSRSEPGSQERMGVSSDKSAAKEAGFGENAKIHIDSLS